MFVCSYNITWMVTAIRSLTFDTKFAQGNNRLDDLCKILNADNSERNDHGELSILNY